MAEGRRGARHEGLCVPEGVVLRLRRRGQRRVKARLGGVGTVRRRRRVLLRLLLLLRVAVEGVVRRVLLLLLLLGRVELGRERVRGGDGGRVGEVDVRGVERDGDVLRVVVRVLVLVLVLLLVHLEGGGEMRSSGRLSCCF